MDKIRFSLSCLSACVSFLLPSCMWMSDTGPLKKRILEEGAPYQVIAVQSKADIPKYGRTYGMNSQLPVIHGQGYSDKIRARDVITISITDLTEQSPFFSKGQGFNYGPMEVPHDGRVSVPYVGETQVIGQTLAGVAMQLEGKMRKISNTSQVSVTRNGRIPETANVIGSVKTPGQKKLERDGYTSIDLLADSGGPSVEEHLATYTLRRNGTDYPFDYKGFMATPFIVESGDLLSVSIDRTNRVHLMGALNKSATLPFPNPNPSLADILGAASGLDVQRSDASGVFVFRKGNPDKVYTINMKDPVSMTFIQRFPMKGEDIVYVTEAPLARWNRMISQLFSATTTPLARSASAAYDVNRLGN